MSEFKFPTEEVELPTKGLLYPKDHPLSSGKVEIKYMTAKEEDILTNTTFIQKGTVLDKLLQAVMEWTRLHHESVTGRDGYSDFYKKDLTINVLGPVGDVVSEWIIKGAFIKDASFSDMNWDDDGTANTIDMTIGMDYCVLNF